MDFSRCHFEEYENQKFQIYLLGRSGDHLHTLEAGSSAKAAYLLAQGLKGSGAHFEIYRSFSLPGMNVHGSRVAFNELEEVFGKKPAESSDAGGVAKLVSKLFGG